METRPPPCSGRHENREDVRGMSGDSVWASSSKVKDSLDRSTGMRS